MMRGHNDDPAFEHSLDHHLEFFSKAGSLMKGRVPYYGIRPEVTALSLFQAIWIINSPEAKLMSMKLLLWLRDPRGGAGNRSGFRECLAWLVTQLDGPKWIQANIDLIPEHGRFDDLKVLFKTPLESKVAELWVKKILDRNHYALKWAKRDMVPLQKFLKTNEAGLRKILAVPERHTIEQTLCANMALCVKCNAIRHFVHQRNRLNEVLYSAHLVCATCGTALTVEYVLSQTVPWTTIEYNHVPSVAMKMYSEAFGKHDPAGFAKFIEDLKSGKTKVNASVLFPHNCIQVVHKGNGDLADQLFKALPDYIAKSGRKIMVLADTSSSMNSSAACPGVRPVDIAIGNALYCSDRLGSDNPFFRRYMEFSSSPMFVDWRNRRFQDVCSGNGYCGSTNIQAALDFLLSSAQMFGATKETMIDTLLIISDMQFDRHTHTKVNDPYGSSIACEGTDQTVVEKCMQAWEAAGFKRPAIAFWNVAGYAGQPATLQTPNTALISGFSPAILTSVLEESQFDSMSILRRAIAKYQVRTP